MKNALMTLTAAACAAVLATQGTLRADVVRPAPDFLFQSSGGKLSSLKSLRGQPVIVAVAPGPRSGAFHKQVGYLEELYRKFASREVVFVAAFTGAPGERAKTDIPFVYPADPGALAAALGAGDGYLLAVIGEDGNLDLVTRKVRAAAYIESVINNAYPVQKRVRQ